MLIGQISSLCFVFFALILTYIILKNNERTVSEKGYKAMSSILAIVFAVRYIANRDSLMDIHSLTGSPIPSKFLTAVSLILNWLLYSVILLVILYPFFKNSKYEVIIKYYGSIVSLLCIIFIRPLTLGIVGSWAYDVFSIRTLFMGIELGILLSYSVIMFFEKGKFKVWKKDRDAFLYIFFMLLCTMPPYLLGGLFGKFPIMSQIKNLNPFHRVIVYGGILIPILLYLCLHKKDKNTIKFVMLYISLGTFLSFSTTYKIQILTDLTKWPIHLCDTLLYIIPICLIFKWDRLFYFTYFINVFGALMAMLMPNYESELNLFDFDIMHFYITHYMAFFMPLLMVALGIYGKPKLKEFKFALVAFVVYFVFVLIANAWLTNYGDVDFFFVNSDFIAKKLGTWAEDTRLYTWVIRIGDLKFIFYPLYQFLFFLGYGVLALAMWFVYEQGYAIAYTLSDMIQRNKKINMDRLALEVSKAKKKEAEMKLKIPGGAQEGENKEEKVKVGITLTNFSKRYGTSKIFAVKDASLHVNGGEIFGFLGNNGAGKSTIIKSIVGIQPLTSGKIEVCGFDVEKEPVLAKSNIGFVPDHYALYEKLTGREYVNYIADLYDVSQEDRDARISKYVELFRLADSFDNQIKTYSHGMKQKIAIMSALVHDPKIWILDEPLTGLDPISIYQVKKCMREHAERGNVVFFSSHIIDVVENICDRVAFINKGEILAVKSLKEIEEHSRLEEFYLNMVAKKGSRKEVKEMLKLDEMAEAEDRA